MPNHSSFFFAPDTVLIMDYLESIFSNASGAFYFVFQKMTAFLFCNFRLASTAESKLKNNQG